MASGFFKLFRPKTPSAVPEPAAPGLRAKFDQASALHRGGQLAAAQSICLEVLELQPDHFDSLNLLGVLSGQLTDLRSAVQYFDRAIAVQPGNGMPYCNRGMALNGLQEFDAALASFAEAIARNDKDAVAHYMRGIIFEMLGRPAVALASYDLAIAANPHSAAFRLHRGNALKELTRLDEALVEYDAAIERDPRYAEAHSNRGVVLLALGRLEAALDSHSRAIQLKPDYAEAYFNRAGVLRINKQFEAAAADYAVVTGLQPDVAYLPGADLEARMQICDWREFDSRLVRIEAGIDRGEPQVHPFPFLGFADSPRLQRKAAEIWASRTCPANDALGKPAKHAPYAKIRVGYFSSDFRQHPVTHLLAELIELHDRDRFEIIAFSFGPDTQDESRKRHERAFDQFLDVQHKTDVEIASLARSLGLEIAVDLCGYVHGGRPQIFALRAAPLQVSYLGYPSTLGADYIDYVVADHILIPPGGEHGFTEKIIFLPDTYQVNDRKRCIAPESPAREELGLPQRGFVFCCFNNNYKILPATFSCWMRILKRVPDSVLWLLEDNASAAASLRRHAGSAGIQPDRLVFAKRVTPSEHLARHRRADLFLDTLPYNAHTTASDALWAGLPVLTCMGHSFAARVAASLLSAVRLPELITSTPEGYEEMAVALATNPLHLRRIRDKLAHHRLTAPLFDSQRFTKHLEAGYVAIHQRYLADLPPDHIRLGAGY